MCALEAEQASILLQGTWYPAHPSNWMDLGCGDGFFTRALAARLASGSVINAWDKDARSLESIPENLDGIVIKKQVCNFITTTLPEQGIDGILMANSLHYVPDQLRFLQRLRSFIQPGGRLIIIEYDRNQANPWVPYPITYSKLEMIAGQTGWTSVQKNGEVNSRYGAKMYAAILQ